MPISLKKQGFTTTIQEYVAEHYTRIENNLKMTSTLPAKCMKNNMKSTMHVADERQTWPKCKMS